jgi:microcystin-dependent protein
MFASAAKLPSGTRITAIAGATVTLSSNATATVTSGAIRFSPIFDAQTLGAVGGTLSHINTLAEIPAASFNGTTDVEGAAHVHGGVIVSQTKAGVAAGGSFLAVQDVQGGNSATENTSHTHAFAGTTNGGGGAHANLQPTIVMNYIIKR